MKAAVLREYHQPLELADRPEPEVTHPDHVVVEVGGAGVCATDLHSIDGTMEAAGVRLPLVLGHENAGWVHAVGDTVTTVAPGDSVIVYPAYSCGLCLPCRRGQDLHCERHQFTGLTVDGGFADQVLVFERQLIKLPPGLEPVDIAPHADVGITAYHAVRRIAHLALPDTTAVVIGIGGVGHIALQLMRQLGASRVIAVDSDERRRGLAAALGADEVLAGGEEAKTGVADLTGGAGAEIVLDFVGTDQTHADGIELLRRGGTYSVVGYGGTISVLSAAMIATEKTVQANLVGTWPDLYELIALHARGRLRLRSETHPLSEINSVLEKLRAGEVTGRAVVVPRLAEEPSVALESDRGRAGSQLREAWIELAVRIGGVDHAAVVVGRREADRRRGRDIGTGEVVRRIANLPPVAMPWPADVEAHVRRNRCRAGSDRAEEVVVVADRNVPAAHARPTTERIDLDRPERNGNRPEQPRRSDAGLEVVELNGVRVVDGAREQVDSYEAERAEVRPAVESDVQPLHEPHVAIERVRRAVTPMGRTAGLGSADDAVEVGDGRHLESDAGQKKVNVRAGWHVLEGREVESARNRARRCRRLSEHSARIEKAQAGGPASCHRPAA